MAITVLALDLEGTLVSNAVSQIPRPGLFRFLEFCRTIVPRIVIFSAVSEARARQVIANGVEAGDMPLWMNACVEYVSWSGPHKNLKFIGCAAVANILIVDDQESYIEPDHRTQWIPIAEFSAPYPTDDTALAEVECALRDRLAREAATAKP